MIIVLGKVRVREGGMEEALAISREHVARSRLEPGCLSHAVHHDADDAMCLVFVEEWQDKASLFQHFQVPESRAFARQLGTLAVERPVMKVFEASEVPLS